MKLVWHEVTRNHHSASVGDVDHVASVLRSQKNRRDGSKHDWYIEVLGSRYHGGASFETHGDPRDLDSMQSVAEARLRLYVGHLNDVLKAKEAKKGGKDG